MLPLTKDWWQTDFSLDGVLGLYAGRREEDGSVDVREWSMRALQRYRYVIGASCSSVVALFSRQRRTLCSYYYPCLFVFAQAKHHHNSPP